MKQSLSRPLLLGHRGAGAAREIAENTFESFGLCLEHGCDGFEFDVRRSADGHAVVGHDPVIRGLRIGHTSAGELRLPSLNEVLQRFAHRAFLDIEIKVAGLEKQLVAALEEHQPKRGYVVSSFFPDVLGRLQSLDSRVPLGFIFDRQYRDQQNALSHVDLEWTIPHFKLVTQELVEEAHGSGEKIMVWTVNRAEDIQRFVDWGVDALVSDETDVLGSFRR